MLPQFYYERRRRKKQKIILIIGLLLFFAGALLIAFLWLGYPTATDVVKPANTPVLGSKATMELTTLYSCGHTETRLLPLPEELKGKSKEETGLLHPEWTLLNFNENFLVAEQKEATECNNHFLLFLQENKIVVTASKDKTKIITEQEINPAVLTSEDKEILSDGIFISSEYELLEILESFQ